MSHWTGTHSPGEPAVRAREHGVPSGRYRAAFEALPTPAVITELGGRVLSANRAAEAAVGIAPLAGRLLTEVAAAEEVRALLAATGAGRAWHGSLRVCSGAKTVLGWAAPMPGEDGAVVMTWQESLDAEIVSAARDFARLVDNQPDIIARLDRGLRHVYVSPSLERETGLTPSGLLGRTHAEVFPASISRKWGQALRRAMRTGTPQRYEFIAEVPDGEQIFDVQILPEYAESGEVESLLCIGRNVTALRQAEQLLRESEVRYRLMVEGSQQVFFYVHDAEHRFLYLSPSVEQVTGYSAEFLLGKPYDVLLEGGDNEIEVHERTHALLDAPESTDPSVYVAMTRHSAGHTVALEIVETATTGPGGTPAVQGFARDVTERYLAENRLREQALRDPLTGMPNRAYFMAELGRAAERAAESPDEAFAVAFLDLDRFKLINDSIGHPAGDRLLTLVADRIRRCLGPADLVARFGGDEFALLIPRAGRESEVSALIDRVLEKVAEPVTLDGTVLFISAAIGLSFGNGRQKPDALLAHADMAMYRAKAAGGSAYRVYDETMHAETAARLELETDLRHALAGDQFTLHYQPVVDLRPGGRVVGMEALLRWRHPRRGMIPPDDFIPVAEETGLIVPIGEWVLRQACHQVPVWKERLGVDAPFTISVNLSPRQFLNRDLEERIHRILEETGTNPQWLAVEITESSVLESLDHSAAVLTVLRDAGLRVYMDDFGTGYASLAYLHRLPLDAIKIDRSFISGITTGSRERKLVASMLALAQSLGLPTIAEGVTSEQECDMLRGMGCEYAQGFLFSPALPPAEAGAMLACPLSPI
jgi:diguanylate cyclase (GGDEF)-like protein/PAS domain S-box-containing protein